MFFCHWKFIQIFQIFFHNWAPSLGSCSHLGLPSAQATLVWMFWRCPKRNPLGGVQRHLWGRDCPIPMSLFPSYMRIGNFHINPQNKLENWKCCLKTFQMECHQNNMRLFLYYMVVNVLNILQSHFLSQKNTTNNNKRVGGKAVQLTRNLNPKPPRLFVFVLDSLMWASQQCFF